MSNQRCSWVLAGSSSVTKMRQIKSVQASDAMYLFKRKRERERKKKKKKKRKKKKKKTFLIVKLSSTLFKKKKKKKSQKKKRCWMSANHCLLFLFSIMCFLTIHC